MLFLFPEDHFEKYTVYFCSRSVIFEKYTMYFSSLNVIHEKYTMYFSSRSVIHEKYTKIHGKVVSYTMLGFCSVFFKRLKLSFCNLIFNLIFLTNNLSSKNNKNIRTLLPY
jgi:hypothetical protein